MKQYHVQRGEWGGVEIAQAKTGWVVTTFSQISGALSGRRVLVKYCAEFPENRLLGDMQNEWTSYADLIIARARTGDGTRRLCKGRLVP